MPRSRTLFDRKGAFAEYQDDELVWVRDDYQPPAEDRGPQVVRDIEPYVSMIDGSVIDGRKRHRDHLRAHNCREIGNDIEAAMKPREQKSISPSRKESLHRMLADVSDRELKQIIQRSIKENR